MRRKDAQKREQRPSRLWNISGNRIGKITNWWRVLFSDDFVRFFVITWENIAFLYDRCIKSMWWMISLVRLAQFDLSLIFLCVSKLPKTVWRIKHFNRITSFQSYQTLETFQQNLYKKSIQRKLNFSPWQIVFFIFH